MYSRTLLLGMICVLVFAVSAACAELVPIPIEGRTLVSAGEMSGTTYTYFIEGMSDNVSPPGPAFLYAELSPEMERVAYHTADALPATTADVWIARLDGSEAVNVSELAGVGGVNCKPVWSPDATQLAFQHAEPTAELYPCEVGFHIWVVNVDGTGAHRVTPPGTAMTWSAAWSANGFRLFCSLLGVGGITIDTDGTDMAVLPNVGDMADWSPDGGHIASATTYYGEDGGESGVWRGLLLTDADGGNPRLLYEHFLSDSDVAEHIALYDHLMAEGDEHRWMWVREGAGPSYPDWSPKGDRVLFRAAIPFDPSGLFYPYQNDLWIYDLTSQTMSRITEDSVCEFYHSWNGPNTFPEDPKVTVDNVTVTFSDVIAEGVTTILRDDDPPEVPTGYQFDYQFYELNTTAEVMGPVTICMTYTDEEVPPGPAEDDLAILHYDEVAQVWEDITTSRDTANNIICGQADSLSPIALHGFRETRFPDVAAWGYGDDGLDPHWAYYHIMACVEGQIVAGFPDGSYQPAGTVSRDQMAVYISRALAGGDNNVPDGPAEASFEDVPTDHWAFKYVEYAVSQGVVQGYDATHYQPDPVVDRGQMAVFIARAKGWVQVDDDMTTAPELFLDVPAGFWSGTAIQACVDHSVVQGYGDGYYRPESVVTRDQMAVYVARAFGLMS
jgi:Tol biopolymer transport system component